MKIRKKEEILNLLKSRKDMKVADLEADLKVPRTTLLRYLKELEDEGRIIKNHGEVAIRESHVESMALPRLKSNVEEKKTIAAKAYEKVEEGDIIFIDSGSTTYYLFELLKDTNVTIYTNSLLAMHFIAPTYKPSVHFISGEVNKKTLAIASPESIFNIQNLIFDKSFVGFNSLLKNGYSTTNESEAILKKVVIQQTSKKAYAMGRKNKSVKRSNFYFAKVEEMEKL